MEDGDGHDLGCGRPFATPASRADQDEFDDIDTIGTSETLYSSPLI
jgi:hypothetical protein